MSLPPATPALVFYTQTIDGRPFVNCLPYSICPVLRWAGYNVPDNYGMTLRKASGVAVQDGLGTSYANMQDAFDKILPRAPVVFGKVTEDELFNDLPKVGRRNTYKDVYSVICQMENLPRHLRRHVGLTWRGLHAIAVAGQRICNGEDGMVGNYDHTAHRNKREVYWMDPMGRTSRGYDGEWALTSDVFPATRHDADGFIKCIHATKKSAVA